MAILFDCECGRPLRAKAAFAGRRTRCPHCGANMTIPEDPSLEAAAAHAAAKAARDLGQVVEELAPISLVDMPIVADSPRISHDGTDEPPSGLAPVSAVNTHAGADAEADPDLDERQYKVLTHKDMGFAAKFDPHRLEETLNRLARRGWVMRSAVVMNLPGHGGHHDELVVILER